VDRYRRKQILLLSLVFLILCTTGCSVIGRSYRWYPDASIAGTTIDSHDAFVFQYGDASLEIDNFPGGGDTYLLGPPLIPMFPNIVAPHREKYPSFIWIETNSPTDETIMDFSRLQLRYPEGKILRVSSVEEWGENRKGSRTEVPIGRTIIASSRRSFLVFFEDFPYIAEEVLLEFGNLDVNGIEVEVPVFKWRAAKKFRYVPLYWD
jgi:hypothetical protein